MSNITFDFKSALTPIISIDLHCSCSGHVPAILVLVDID